MGRSSSIAMLVIFLTIAFTVVGQLLVKQGMVEVGRSPAQAVLLPRFVLQALTNLKVIGGLACAVAAALAWMVALSRSDLSFAYPFMGLAIVLVLALSPLVFGERIPITRWLGVLVVCAGLWIAARSG
jgi:multidrug transporter EmrE-like cation transporter